MKLNRAPAHWTNDMGISPQITTAILSPIRPVATERLDSSLRRAVVGPAPSNGKTMMTIGSNASVVSYADVCAVPRPGSTYHPKTGNKVYADVSYATIMDGLRDFISDLLGSDPVYETYTLSGGANPGQELYGRIAWESGVPGMMIELIFRSSYGGTLCFEYGMGQGTEACANGMFSADQIVKIKHTHNIMERFRESLTMGSKGVANIMERIEYARQRIEWVNGLKEIPMSDDLFHAFCGVLQGRHILQADGKKLRQKMLTPHRASAARKYWGACHAGQLHDDHGNRDLFSAYQALTGANHLSTPRNAIRDGAGVDFMVEQVEKSGGCITGIPAFTFEVAEF